MNVGLLGSWQNHQLTPLRVPDDGVGHHGPSEGPCWNNAVLTMAGDGFFGETRRAGG